MLQVRVWRPSEADSQSLNLNSVISVIWRHKFAEGIKVSSNDYFRGIRRHCMLIHWRSSNKGQ